MGVRPPSGDSEPEPIEFGIAALAAEVSESDLSFPATREEIEEALGDIRIAYDASGNSVALSRVLDRAEEASFDSERDFLNALHPVFEDLRTTGGAGIVGWLRSLFP